MIEGTVLGRLEDGCIVLLQQSTDASQWYTIRFDEHFRAFDTHKDRPVRDDIYRRKRLTMLFGLTSSVTTSVPDYDHRHCWVDFDIDERVLFVSVVFGHKERRRIQLFGSKRAA
jgi:hypothetical protein